MTLISGENDADRRLDRILRRALREQPLSLIHRLLRQGKVRINGKTAAAFDRVKAGSEITIEIPGARLPEAFPSRPGKAAELPLIWEGAGILVLNKAPGMAVHGPGSLDTLVQANLAGRLSPSLSFRPGPLHRLDKPTSGLIVFSANIAGARFFSSLLHRRLIKKQYLALLEGRIEKDDVWQDELVRDKTAKKTFNLKNVREKAAADSAKPKAALTKISPLALSPAGCPGYSLVIAEIESGRTHQIRAQAAARGCPLAGDIKYGGHALPGRNRRGGGFFLHAWKLMLCEAESSSSGENFPRLISTPPPPAFQEQITRLFGGDFPSIIAKI